MISISKIFSVIGSDYALPLMPSASSANKPRKTQIYNRFDAAKKDRLHLTWNASHTDINEELQDDLLTLRIRSRDAWKNNDYIKSYIEQCKINIVGHEGPGFQVKSSSKISKEKTQEVEKAFKHWGKKGNCEVSGRLSWRDCLNLFVETMERDGEVIIRKHYNYPGNKTGFAIEFIDVSRLDIDFTDYSRNIIMGVEFGKHNNPVAYWINEQKIPGYYNFNFERKRIPANSIIHSFVTHFSGQIRGVPSCHTALERLTRINRIEQAELVASEVSAKKMGFITKNLEGLDGYSAIEENEENLDDDGNIIEHAEAGSWHRLPAGSGIEMFDPTHPNPNISILLKDMLRGAAAGLNINANTLSKDLSNVNFSSIRHGAIEDQETWKQKQAFLFTEFCYPITENWLALNGDIFPDVSIDDVKFIGRRWGWVRPLEEAKAESQAVDMMIKSPQRIMREKGYDVEDEQSAIEEYLKWQKEMNNKYRNMNTNE